MKRLGTAAVTLGFVGLTIAVTWPLAADPAHTLASDFGDPLFVSWVIGWVADHITRAAGGDLDAFLRFWDANIFFPERHTLAFSEHFFAQTLPILPAYWATGNLLLCYNLALMLSFVLSGVGAHLLVRDLTGSMLAGVAAGVFFAFNEYRLMYEVSHLQTLSMYWLPFALLGFHRYIAAGSRRALAAGAAALVLLNLSAGFFILFCTPFVVAFVLFDLVRHGAIARRQVWVDLGAAALAAIALTAPFAWPYVAMQQRTRFERPIAEVIQFSATLDHYRAALPGFSIPLAFGLIAIGLSFTVASARRTGTRSSVDRPLVIALVVALLMAFWLSLGPVVQGGGQTLGLPGPYRVLYDYVPGFKGVRAAARFGMLFFFFLALLAGAGVALVESRWKRVAQAMAVVGCAVFLWQTRPAPFPLDRPWPFVSAGLAATPSYLHPGPKIPSIYRWVEQLNRDAVLVEFPFGDLAYDLRYMFFSATHHRRMLGGYSGIFPASFLRRRAVLEHPLEKPADAWDALADATHAIVHVAAWPDGTGDAIARWLHDAGARELAGADGARLFQLPRATSRSISRYSRQ